ncbi:DUF5082 domain-containing protein [Cytobacillus kochii]|uniref:YwqH-like family protein n=1 Tax=Cytobacillus kochii TaxID=859143 RepID=UPI001CD4ABE9|nr:DUF5082 family protein [Cytobacillus kochii]MCA1029243.1 DUF5082 domain-containing protein [Cytobacillus kochii]
MSISYYTALLQQKKNELARLHTCNGQLEGTQQEFSHFRRTVLQPELTPHTWHGQNANEFEQKRESMLSSYDDLQGNQFNQVFNSLQNKMQSLQSEIQSIQQTISYLEAQERAKNQK